MWSSKLENQPGSNEMTHNRLEDASNILPASHSALFRKSRIALQRAQTRQRSHKATIVQSVIRMAGFHRRRFTTIQSILLSTIVVAVSTAGLSDAFGGIAHLSFGERFASCIDNYMYRAASQSRSCVTGNRQFSTSSSLWSKSAAASESNEEEGSPKEGETPSRSQPGKKYSYDLGLGKNAPLHLRKQGKTGENHFRTSINSSSVLDDVSAVSENWMAPAPVNKPLSIFKETTYDLGLGKNRPIGSAEVQDIVTFKKLIAKDQNSEFLSRAVWDKNHYDGASEKVKRSSRSNDDLVVEAVAEAVRIAQQSASDFTGKLKENKDASKEKASDLEAKMPVEQTSGSVAGNANVSTSNNASANRDAVAATNDTEAPELSYEDIDLSIPLTVYCPQSHVDLVWNLMRLEAKREADREPLLVSFLHSTILNHPSLESALAFHLANRLSSPAMISTQILSLIREALDKSPDFRKSLRADMMAVRDRDPACTCLPDVFLYFKGFHALQTYRVAHYLWRSGRRVLAHHLQSQVSQNFQIDIHPNATLGSGIMLDHGTGIVIGETATLGHNCSVLHHVTLGGSGKKGVDRHPKVGNGVLLGAGASVLGNIKIGDGCQVGAGTLVIGDLPPHSVAVGVPAKIIGSFVDVTAQPSVGMNQLGSKEADANIVTFETEGI